MLKMVMSRRSVDSFCLIVLKYFVGEPFCVVLQKISGFFPNLPKDFIEESTSVSIN